MKRNCPNSDCLFFKKNNFVQKNGLYRRQSDSRRIQRFKCTACSKRFSTATGTLEFKQKKRRVNHKLFLLLCSGLSQRRAALILGINRKTVVKKFKYLGVKSKLKNEALKKFYSRKKVTHLQIDDLVSKESSKLKPLSVSLAVDVKSRYILGAKVSTLRAFGHLASKGREKYPNRKNTHKQGLTDLFEKIKDNVDAGSLIQSDEHKLYPEFIRHYFPQSKHETFRSERGCIAGQGELKKVTYDPLFVINHTCAMLRGNINRLFRRTWCTTKDAERLQDHLDIFINFYNFYYLKLPPH